MIESNVIGCLIAENALIAQCEVSVDDFHKPDHRQIFVEMQKLAIQRKAYDVVILAQHMDKIAGGNWLPVVGAIAQQAPSRANFRRYCELLIEESNERKSESIGNDLAADHDAEKALTALMNLERVRGDYSTNVTSAIKIAVEGVEAITGGKPAGIKTGIRDLDKKLGGFHRTDLVVIGGRPSMGKTSVAMNIMHNIAEPIGIMSAEQSAEQIGQRMIALSGSVSVYRMRNGSLTEEDWSSASEVMREMLERQFFINDKPGMTLRDVIKEARSWKYNHNIEILFVDYLQKIKSSHEKKREEISQVVTSLKDLAKELDICVVALAQIRRDVDERKNKRPFMSDLAESSIIEQEADQVITLYRDEVYNKDTQTPGVLELILCKNRHGPLGTILTTWIPEYMQVKDYQEMWPAGVGQ